MRLSEAIRAGARLRRKQAFGVLLDSAGGTCALGAAADAVGGLDTETRLYRHGWKAPQEWHSLVKAGAKCPECGTPFKRLDDCIVHMNNVHKLRRNRIADFVATLEAAMPPTREKSFVSRDPQTPEAR
jgi:hypothetical protein